MTLDEAIKHAEEVAEQNKWFEENYLEHKGCKECAEEHRQLAEWLKELKAYKKQEPCTDAVSRQAVLDGIDTYINKAQSTGTIDNFISFAELVVKALPSVNPQPCDDAISREAVIGELKDMYKAAERWSQDATEDDIKARADAVMATLTEQKLRVEALPSVMQKSGKWQRVSIEKYIQHAMAYYECSECGGQTIGEPNYCPNCGAKMESEE